MSQLALAPMMLAALCHTARRRLRGGPLRPSWSFLFEVTVEVLRRQSARTRALPPAQARAHWERQVQPDPALREVHREPAALGGVPGEWFAPVSLTADAGTPSLAPAGRGRPDAGTPFLLYLHGGSFQHGSTQVYAPLLARLTLAHGGRTLAINYRLAPEHPFPAPVDDAVAAYRALLESGVAARRVVVGGDSAGGGLTLALMLRARAAGLPLPAGGLLICPWVDHTARGGSMTDNERYDWALALDFVRWTENYLQGADPRDPLASPLFADLRGLPPLLLQVGEAEMLLDQVRELAQRAQAAGVAAALSIAPDMIHNWHILTTVAAMLPGGGAGTTFTRCQEAIDQAGAFICSCAA